MSSSAKKFTEIATVTALCKHLHKGVVRNRLTGSPYNIAGNSNPKFAFMMPNFKDDQIEVNGSLTWGSSGFSLELLHNLTEAQNCKFQQSN